MSPDVVVLPGADRVPHGFIDLVTDPSGTVLTWKYIPVMINGCPVHFSSAVARVVAPAGPASVVIGRPGGFRLLAPRVDVVVQPEQAVPVFYYRSWIKGDPGALTLERIKRPSPYEKQWLVIVVILLAVLAFHLLSELMKRL